MSTKILKDGPVRAANNYRRAEIEFLHLNQRLTLRQTNKGEHACASDACYGATFQLEVPDSSFPTEPCDVAVGCQAAALPPSFHDKSCRSFKALPEEASGQIFYRLVATLVCEGTSAMYECVEQVSEPIRICNEAWRIGFLETGSSVPESSTFASEIFGCMLRSRGPTRSWKGLSIMRDSVQSHPAPTLVPSADGGYSGKIVLTATAKEDIDKSLPCLGRATGDIYIHTAYRSKAAEVTNCCSGEVITSKIQATIDHVDSSPWCQSSPTTQEYRSSWTIEWSTRSGPLTESFYASLISRWYELHLKLFPHPALLNLAEPYKVVIPVRISSITPDGHRQGSDALCQQMSPFSPHRITGSGYSQAPPVYAAVS